MKKLRFQNPTGTHDLLPDDMPYFRHIYNVVSEMADFYGFSEIETPIIEETDLFSKGLGISTDIVQKQMYSFTTKGRDNVTLRPEMTAPIARAYIQHGMFTLPQPVKLFSCGSLFRYESSQSGRYRQFRQFDFESLGEAGSVIDVQIMQIFSNILKELGFKNLNIQINSIGDSQCRPYYKKLLLSFLRSRANSLCSDCRRRLKENPLRILDCKNETCKAIGVQAPQAINHLCGDCHRHFKEVLEFLEEINLPYQLNPFLVRGLDYYTKTVFEFFDEGQTAIALAGGGRYDNLVKSLGGSDTAAVGAAAGVERIVEAMKKRSINPPQKAAAKVFLAQLGELAKKRSLKVLEDFRKAKIPVVESLGRDSLKVQLGRANKIEADYTVIIGQKEALEETAIVRNMKTGRQETVKIEEITVKIKEQLKRSPKKTIVKTIN